jgi:HEAT repeat protein
MLEDLESNDLTSSRFLAPYKALTSATDINYLINMLSYKNDDVCSEAANALIALGEKVLPYLLPIVESDDEQVRYWVIYILGKFQNRQVLNVLISRLNSRDAAYVAFSLGELGDKKATNPLIEALSNDDWYVRTHAAKALGKIGDATAVKALIELLSDKNPQVRLSGVEALAALKAKQALPYLQRVAKEDQAIAFSTIVVGKQALEAIDEIINSKI